MKSLKLPEFAFIALIAIAYIFIFAYNPNSVEDKSSEFNMEEAQTHLSFLANEPHPIGTKAHAEVQNYIMVVGRALGYEMEVVEHTKHSSYNCTQHLTAVQNIHAFKKGTDSDGIIVFAAHYDSQPNTLGAADDGQAVAAFLTNMTKIASEETKNDILFLITDAEETGLNGAKAFVEYYDRKDEIKYVFNFEARGNSGPLFAFETSENNSQVMKTFRSIKNARRFTSSLMYEIYKMLPNDTDFTIFKRMGIKGISMANIDGFVNYHSMTDSPANLNANTFYHHGLMVNDLLEIYKNADLTEKNQGNSTYFNLLGSFLVVQYPPWWNLFFWFIAIALLVLFTRKSIEKFSFLKYLKYFLLLIVVIAIGLGLGFIMRWLILAIYPHYTNFYSQNFYNGPQYYIPFAGVMALLIISYLKSSFQMKDQNFKYTHIAGLSLFAILGIVSYFTIQTASYFFIIPLLSYLLIQLINRSKESNPWIDIVAMIIPIALIMPFSYMFSVVFSLALPYAGMISFVLCFIMVTPLLTKVQRVIPIFLAMIIVLGLIRAHSRSSITELRPYQAQFHYQDDIDMSSNSQRFTNARLVNNDKRVDYVEEQVLEKYNTRIPTFDSIFTSHVDTITNNMGERMKKITLKLKSKEDFIRVDMTSKKSTDWQNIVVNNKSIDQFCRVRYLGDLEKQPFTVKFTIPLDIQTEAIITTYERGLLDKMHLGPTVIPGPGFFGGTILHNYRFTW